MTAERRQPQNDTADGSRFDHALGDFTDDARRAAARDDRLQRHDQRHVAGLSGTFLGTLADLAESNRPAMILTRSGAHHRGIVAAIGADVVVLAADLEGRRILLSTDAIEGVRTISSAPSRELLEPPLQPDLVSLLDDSAEERCRVAIVTSGGNRLMGSIEHVGLDQLTIRLDGDADHLTIPIDAIDEAVVES